MLVLAVLMALVSLDGLFASAYTANTHRIARFQQSTRLHAEPGTEGAPLIEKAEIGFSNWHNDIHPKEGECCVVKRQLSI